MANFKHVENVQCLKSTRTHSYKMIKYNILYVTIHFLVAKLLYNYLCPPVRRSVRPYVRHTLGETWFSPGYNWPIELKLSGFIPLAISYPVKSYSMILFILHFLFQLSVYFFIKSQMLRYLWMLSSLFV